MSDWTKEPWVEGTSNNHSPAIRGADGSLIAVVNVQATVLCRVANARRIVAAINHCAGLSTETLESGPDMVGLIRAASVGAELLAALESACGLEAQVRIWSGDWYKGSGYPEMFTAWRALITRARGEAPPAKE